MEKDEPASLPKGATRDGLEAGAKYCLAGNDYRIVNFRDSVGSASQDVRIDIPASTKKVLLCSGQVRFRFESNAIGRFEFDFGVVTLGPDFVLVRVTATCRSSSDSSANWDADIGVQVFLFEA